MTDIIYIDRQTGEKRVEKVYHQWALRLLYGHSRLNATVRSSILPLLAKSPLFSAFYGYLQKCSFSAKKIRPFIEKFRIDPSEFLDPISNFRCFNDFFIRRLKPEARPISADPNTAIIPADGRYYFYPHVDQCAGFLVKGEKFALKDLLQNASLANEYQEGSLVLARLCPSDYHRFHFPCACLPGSTRLLNGWLYSVNPWAIKRNIHIFSQNKRTLCELESAVFGRVLYLEVGATAVGSIQETYQPNHWQEKGAEKGYFEFGGSSLILLFPKNSITFDADLLAATEAGWEIRCLLGQSMGKA